MGGDFVGTGWAFPLGVRPNGGIALASGVDKLEQAMRLVLLTYPGERPMRPEFGCVLRDYVFHGASPESADEIAREVEASLRRWEPRVDVEAVRVLPMADTAGGFDIDITYRIKETNDERNLVVPFYSIPGEPVPGQPEG